MGLGKSVKQVPGLVLQDSNRRLEIKSRFQRGLQEGWRSDEFWGLAKGAPEWSKVESRKKALEEALFLGDMPFYGWNQNKKQGVLELGVERIGVLGFAQADF